MSPLGLLICPQTMCISSGCLPISSYSLASYCVLRAPHPYWFESTSPLVFIEVVLVPLALLSPFQANLRDHLRPSRNRAPAAFHTSRTLYAPIRAYG